VQYISNDMIIKDGSCRAGHPLGLYLDYLRFCQFDYRDCDGVFVGILSGRGLKALRQNNLLID
jgi:hypothetical protein